MEEINEYEVNKLFQSIISEMSQINIGREKAKKYLKSTYSYSEENIEIAFRLLEVIGYISRMAAPGRTLPGVKIMDKGSDVLLSYSDKERAYSVCIDKISDLKKRKTVFNFDSLGTVEEIPCSLEEMIFGLAVHMVRQELQSRRLFKIFTPHTVTCDGRINSFILFEKIFFEYEQKRFPTKKKLGIFKKTELSDAEFDARLIERLFLAKIAGQKISEAKIRRLLFLDPTKLFY